MRQDEHLLIKAVNELALGCPSAESIAFIKSLDRPLNVSSDKKKVLVSQNILADINNSIELEKIDKPSMRYRAIDSGKKCLLTKLPVQKVTRNVSVSFLPYCLN